MSQITQVPLGRTGLMVSRIGIGCSYGVDAVSMEEAFDRGINYFYFGSLRRRAMAEAIHTLAPKHRERLVVVIQSYARIPWLLRRSVDAALRKLRLDYADLLLLGKVDSLPSQSLVEEARRLRDTGKVRFLAISAHNRAMFREYIRGGVFDVLMARYNAANTGAEREVFPLMPAENRPGMVCYTATRWGTLLQGAPGERAPRASDCYRFVLHNPAVDVCLCGPKNRKELQEGLQALSLPPLTEEEMNWMRRVGESVYRLKRRNLLQTLFD